MTKFILHSGYTGAPVKDNQRFFKEIVKGIKEPITILCVYFASKKSKWRELLENDKDNFQKNNPNKNLKLTMATPHNFRHEAKKAKILYLRGGNKRFIERYFASLKDFKRLIRGKVVAGSSAGANVLSKYYFSTARHRVIKGTGILPIKFFCHYSDKEFEKLKRLIDYKENLKTYKLPEHKYFVLKKNF